MGPATRGAASPGVGPAVGPCSGPCCVETRKQASMVNCIVNRELRGCYSRNWKQSAGEFCRCVGRSLGQGRGGSDPTPFGPARPSAWPRWLRLWSRSPLVEDLFQVARRRRRAPNRSTTRVAPLVTNAVN